MTKNRSTTTSNPSKTGMAAESATVSNAAGTPIYISVDTDKNQSLIHAVPNSNIPTLYVNASYDKAGTQPVPSAEIVFSFCPAYYGDPRRGGASTASVWPLSQRVSIVNGKGSCSGFAAGVCTGDIWRQESDRDMFGTAYIYAHGTDISGLPFTDADKPYMAAFTVKVAVMPVAASSKCRLVMAAGNNQFMFEPPGYSRPGPMSSPLLGMLVNEDDSTIVTGVPIEYSGRINLYFQDLVKDQPNPHNSVYVIVAETRNGFPSSTTPYCAESQEPTPQPVSVSVPSMSDVAPLTFEWHTSAVSPANATALFPSMGNMQSTRPNTLFPHNLTTAVFNDSVNPATPLIGAIITYEITSGNAVFDYTETVVDGQFTPVSPTKANCYCFSSYLVPSPYVKPTSDNGVVTITATCADALQTATFTLLISASAPIPSTPSSTSKITLINDGQTTSPGLAFGNRLQAKVQDSFGAPVENVLLTFTITSDATFDINDKPDLLEDATPSTARARTNASGVATAPKIIAGNATGDVKVQVATPIAAPQTYTLHVQSGTINPGDGDAYRIDVLTGSRLSMSRDGQASPQFALTDTTSGRRMPNTPMQMDVGNTGGASVSFSLTDPTMQSTTVTTNDEGIALVTVYSADAAGSATLLASYPGADSKTVIISVS
ncbi:hypothetical protein [Bordetella sp. LUAb4]|uniref:hypothetical protein n=1 Tax=Bordetella sp. LUAb4 TaxID=2843195 RepID=UPI001E3FF855|nr:hypothetical protein [Bordetella sp. LUAb4]